MCWSKHVDDHNSDLYWTLYAYTYLKTIFLPCQTFYSILSSRFTWNEVLNILDLDEGPGKACNIAGIHKKDAIKVMDQTWTMSGRQAICHLKFSMLNLWGNMMNSLFISNESFTTGKDCWWIYNHFCDVSCIVIQGTLHYNRTKEPAENLTHEEELLLVHQRDNKVITTGQKNGTEL